MLALCCRLNVFSATSLKVLLTLKKPKEQKESPFLVFHVANMGINTKVRKYDMCAATYIRKIALKCLEFKGQSVTAHQGLLTQVCLYWFLWLCVCSQTCK